MKTKAILSAATTAFILSTPTLQANQGTGFEVGLVNVGGSSIYAGKDNASATMPSIAYKAGQLSVSVQEGFAYQLRDDETLELSVAIKPNFKPYKASDSSSLTGMNRDMYFDTTLNAGYTLGRGLTLNLNFATELTNRFNGNAIDASISQFFPVLGQPVIFSAGAKWQNAARANYLYGVNASEATGSRAQYAPGAATTTYLGVSTFHSFSEQTSMFVNLSANYLPSNVSNSPIISKTKTVSSVIGFSYSF